ncbi:Glyoxal oxidase [Pleurotus pulmonarius]
MTVALSRRFSAFIALALLQCVAAVPSVGGRWRLVQEGTTGVSGMQLAVVSETKAIIFDKVEANPLQTQGHAAWSAEIDLPSRTVRPLNPITNTWCATGSFLSNGTFIHSAGNPFVDIGQGDIGPDGRQALRMFTPCNDESCDIIEDAQHLRLTSKRWYAASARLEDGSMMIFGGSMANAFINNATINNPTFEFFPPKNINGFNGLQIPTKFMVDTMKGNHFPNVHTLPDGRLFVSANQQAMLFDWKTNTETRLPGIPNGVRISSPFSGSAVLLPLTIANNFTPEIMICGGSVVDDTLAEVQLSSQMPASAQCARMVLTPAGIRAGWKVESMPQPRIMVELILLPDGRVLAVNGAQTGVAGINGTFNPVGFQSNADKPALTAAVYDPDAPVGRRFSSAGIPASKVPRMYHSTASLTPDGSIILAGSNPNEQFTTEGRFPSEYRMEFLSPPFMFASRPTVISGVPATVDFGKTFTLNVDLPSNARDVSVSLMDLGFATHGVHMDQKLVQLRSTLSRNRKTLQVTAPRDGQLFSPGPGFLFIVTDGGVPSVGHRLIIGTGASPPVDQGAIDNMLRQTSA